MSHPMKVCTFTNYIIMSNLCCLATVKLFGLFSFGQYVTYFTVNLEVFFIFSQIVYYILISFEKNHE